MILLIEDDHRNVDLIRSIAKRLGMELLTSFDGSNVMTLLHDNTICMVLLDLRLPNGMDGWQIAQHIRQQDIYDEIPILAVSATSSADDQPRAIAAGCNQYIAKPYRVDSLMMAIRENMPKFCQ